MCFVTLCGIEEKLLGPLLSHTQAVTVNAACLSFKHRFIYQYELCEKIQKGVSVLLQNIIPVEPHVHATCIQADCFKVTWTLIRGRLRGCSKGLHQFPPLQSLEDILV